jgi:hypothetical protein
MPFVLLVVGLALVISAYQNTQSQLYALLVQDFTGQGSFTVWVIAILVIGGLGYIKPIKPITDAFLILVIIVLFLSNGGFFAKFTQAAGIQEKTL